MRLATAAVILLLLPSTAAAQRPSSRPPRPASSSLGFVFVDFGMAWHTANELSQTVALDAREEVQSESHLYRFGESRAISFGGGFWLTPRLGVGVAVDRAQKSNAVDVSLTIPHLFEFDQDMTDEVSLPVTRKDLAVHIDALFRVPVSERVQMTIFGGASRLSLTQGMVADYQILESIDFAARSDTFEILPETLVIDDEKDSVWGFNVGADVSVFFTRVLGAGFTLRFTGAGQSAELRDKLEEFYTAADPETPLIESTPDGQFSPLKLGGFSIAGGLRIRF
jgi:hypothetical protein